MRWRHFFTTFGDAVSGAAKWKKFVEWVWIILSQAQNGLKFINAIAGAGFDISTDVGKKLSILLMKDVSVISIMKIRKATRSRRCSWITGKWCWKGFWQKKRMKYLKWYADVFGKGKAYYYTIFSLGGFTQELIDYAEGKPVKLISLEDMY